MDLPPDHPARQFERAVDASTYGPSVALAVERQRRILARPDLTFDAERLHRFERFCAAHCRLSQGQFAGEPLQPLPWLSWLLAHLLCTLRPDGMRHYRRVYIETAKGTGKTPTMAALGLYLAFFEGEAAAQGYVAAATKEQAGVLTRAMRSYVEGSSALQGRILVYGNEEPNKIIAGDSSIRLVASRRGGIGLSGPSPHVILIDEFHEVPSRDALDTLDAGTKLRRQPVRVILTNAGVDMHSPCGQEHQSAMRLLEGTAEDDETLALIADCDEGPWDDERLWLQCGLGMPVTPGLQYFRTMAGNARSNPLTVPDFERRVLNRWGRGVAKFLPIDTWESLQRDDLPPERHTWACAIGVDMSTYADLTGVAVAWSAPDGTVYVQAHAFTPTEGLIERARADGSPYLAWIEAGHMSRTEGATVAAPEVALWVQAAIAAQSAPVIGIAMDHYRATEFAAALAAAGTPCQRLAPEDAVPANGILPIFPHPQGVGGMRAAAELRGLTMPGSIDGTIKRALNGRLVVRRSPVLTQAVLGLGVAKDAHANATISRNLSTGRIDPAVALIEAVGLVTADLSGRHRMVGAILDWATREDALQAPAQDSAPPDPASSGTGFDLDAWL